MSSKMQIMPLSEAIIFNPKESIPKGLLKKIAMGQLTEHTRKISGYELSDFSGGAKFRNGDTLLAKITPCLENGKTAQVDILDDNEVGFGSTEFIVLRATEKTNPDFVYYLSRSPFFRNKAISCMEGTSGRKRVNEKLLATQLYKFPEIKTQAKISKILKDLDTKIELNNKINAELEAMAKTLYDYWFVQFDFPDKNGRPYKSSGGKMVWNEELKREIPEGWEVTSLYDIATYTNGLACQKYRPKGEGRLRVIKIKEMNEGFSDKTEFTHTDVPEKVIVNDGDVLFSWSASLDIKLWTGGKGVLNQHIFKVTSDLYPKSFYFYQILSHLEHFKMMADLRKTTMGHITLDHLKDGKTFIPSGPIIRAFDQTMSPTLMKSISLKQENQTLSELRDWLLPMLMNGQVVVGF